MSDQAPRRVVSDDPELIQLAGWAEQQLERLADSAFDAILNRIPLYRNGQAVSHADLRRSVGNNIGFVLNAIAQPEAELNLAVPQETGRRRAQQSVPLPEVLQAYRISFATLWDALLQRARDSGQPAALDSLLTAASMIWELTDEHALALTETYRSTTAEMLLAKQRRRSALVEALLTGQPGPEAGLWAAASLLGFPPDADHVVIAAETRALAEESLPNIGRRLADQGIVSGWRLTPALQLGIVSIHPGQREQLLQILDDAATTRTGVSPSYRRLADTPRALQLARSALAGIPTGEAEVRTFDPSPLAALMACEPGEGTRLADQVLGSVLALPSADRAVLLDTLHAYLDHEGSAERAGEVLHCHPNTVRYRLRRLQELTGRSLSDPYALAELATASFAVRTNAPGAPRAAGRGNHSA